MKNLIIFISILLTFGQAQTSDQWQLWFLDSSTCLEEFFLVQLSIIDESADAYITSETWAKSEGFESPIFCVNCPEGMYSSYTNEQIDKFNLFFIESYTIQRWLDGNISIAQQEDLHIVLSVWVSQNEWINVSFKPTPTGLEQLFYLLENKLGITYEY